MNGCRNEILFRGLNRSELPNIFARPRVIPPRLCTGRNRKLRQEGTVRKHARGRSWLKSQRSAEKLAAKSLSVFTAENPWVVKGSGPNNLVPVLNR